MLRPNRVLGLTPSASKLSELEYRRVAKEATRFLRTHPCIRNRDVRKMTGIGYDQAVFLFGRMVKEGALERVGTRGGTKYVLPRPPATRRRVK